MNISETYCNMKFFWTFGEYVKYAIKHVNKEVQGKGLGLF